MDVLAVSPINPARLTKALLGLLALLAVEASDPRFVKGWGPPSWGGVGRGGALTRWGF